MISIDFNDYMLDIKGVDDSLSYLCLKCGKCCKLLTFSENRISLLQKENGGDVEAAFWLKNLIPYIEYEEACSIEPSYFNKILMQTSFGQTFENTYFYGCKCLLNNNMCDCYSSRPSKCSNFPSNPWEVLPDGCGYLGWQFEQKELYKQRVRKLKDILYELSYYKDGAVVGIDGVTAMELRLKIVEKIEPFRKFGSDSW